MIVKPDKSGARVRLRHQNGRRTLPTTDVRDRSARIELAGYPVERGNPIAHEVSNVSRPKELLATVEYPSVVFVPSHACTRAERFRYSRHGVQGAQREFKRARNIRRAVFRSQCQRLLVVKAEALGLGIVVDLASRSLRG